MKQNQDIELEYKFQVKDKNALIKVLDKLAPRKLDRQYQGNVMFDNPQGLMQKTDGRIRVRTLGETGIKVLTYKKPLPSENGAKRELEYEIKFEDQAGQIEKILSAMEFVPSTSYERYQTKWEIDGAYITLDEYPFANLLEIEGVKEKILELAEKLGFKISDGLTKPVDTLFQEWRKDRGLSFKPQMKFNDYDK